MTADPRCAWHGDETTGGWKPEDEDSPYASCGRCGMLIATKDCEGCGLTFLDWSFRGSDDVLSGPYGTSDGDLVCERCCETVDREEREREDEWDQMDWSDESYFV